MAGRRQPDRGKRYGAVNFALIGKINFEALIWALCGGPSFRIGGTTWPQ